MNTVRLKRNAMDLFEKYQKSWPYVAGVLLILIIYSCSKAREVTNNIYHAEGKLDFKDGRILGSQGDSIYEGKERLFSKTVKDLVTTQEQLKELNSKLEKRIQELEKPKTAPEVTKTAEIKKDAVTESGTGPENNNSGAQRAGGVQGVQAGESGQYGEAFNRSLTYSARSPRGARGPAIVSFPVKDVLIEENDGVALPAGSYVKAKLMTGVEAPEGRTYPVLLQLDYAYIMPNKKKLDLSGCFMIVKSQGDLSTERVQMQASKLSCVSKTGKMFERDVNGFVADDKDNSFAVIGSVSSKQDRVAAMAFLSSVVEGVGKALQQAQTTAQVNPMGGSSSTVTGDQLAYLGGGGAANAAGMVTQWYLKQAQNLLPTVNVGSGQDVWVVMGESVKLPREYFRKSLRGAGGIYAYFSRIAD